MEVSFTGINNLYVGKKAYSKIGSFISPTGGIKQGNIENFDVMIKCDVTDDENGKHLSDFYSAVKKCNQQVQQYFINSKKPNHIELLTQKIHINDEPAPVSFSVLKLNGGEAVIENRDILGLYTYLAKLTRDIVSMDTTSRAQKQCVKSVNESIHNEAIDYIDNIM